MHFLSQLFRLKPPGARKQHESSPLDALRERPAFAETQPAAMTGTASFRGLDVQEAANDEEGDALWQRFFAETQPAPLCVD